MKSVLMEFFEAENQRDWVKYRQYISPNIVWELHSPHNNKTIVGADNYIAYMQDVYEKYNNTFCVETLLANESETRIVAILVNNLGEKSCDVFEFEDGVIVREYEFILD
ncbi:hypothetical protein FACS1894111_11840 [Clostridia bacterium]|nr:hypothetical protein FACS1894111_11840 [Clostridia bacterium]